MRRRSAGFTLVELLVTTLAAALVMGAVSALLLLGLRVNRVTLETASRRQDVQIILTMMEELIENGTVTIQQSAEANSEGPWSIEIKNGESTTTVAWTGAEPGKTGVILVNSAPVLENVAGSWLWKDATADKLLNLWVRTVPKGFANTEDGGSAYAGNMYKITMYCPGGLFESEAGLYSSYLK